MKEYKFYPEYDFISEYGPNTAEEGSCPTEFPSSKKEHKESKESFGRRIIGKISAAAAMALASALLLSGTLNAGSAESDMKLKELEMTRALVDVSSDLSLSDYEYPIYYSLYHVEEEYPTLNQSGIPLYSDIAEDPKPFNEKYKLGAKAAAGKLGESSASLNFDGLSSGTTYVLVLRASEASEAEIIGKELVFTTPAPESDKKDNTPPKQNQPASPSPIPASSPSPTPAVSPSPSPSPTPTAKPSPSPSPTPTPTAKPSPTPTPSPRPYVPYVPPEPPAPVPEDIEIIAPVMVSEYAFPKAYEGADWVYLDSDIDFVMDINALKIPESEKSSGVVEVALNGCNVPADVSYACSGGYVNEVCVKIPQGYQSIIAPGGSSMELYAMYFYSGGLGKRTASGSSSIIIVQGEKPSGSITGVTSSYDGTFYRYTLNYHLNLPSFTDIDSVSVTPYYTGDNVLSVSMPDASGNGSFEIQSDQNFVIGQLDVAYTLHPDPIDLSKSVTGTINIPYNHTAA